MAKYYTKILDEDGNEFPLAVNITGHGAPTEDTEAEPGMCYLDEDSETGDLYKCIGVLVTEEGKAYRWKKLADQDDVASLKTAIGKLGNPSWNDLTDKPFESGIGELDIIPEQQVTFSDGVAKFTGWVDPVKTLGILEYYGTADAVLEVNGEVIEGTIKEYIVVTGTFGAYTVSSGTLTITLGDGATVQNGETATVRMYAISEVVETLDPKFLPKNAANAVSYESNQNLTVAQQSNARRNIRAYAAKRTTILTQRHTIVTQEGVLFDVDVNELTDFDLAHLWAIKFVLEYDAGVGTHSASSSFVFSPEFNNEGGEQVVTVNFNIWNSSTDNYEIVTATVLMSFSVKDNTITATLINISNNRFSLFIYQMDVFNFDYADSI